MSDNKMINVTIPVCVIIRDFNKQLLGQKSGKTLDDVIERRILRYIENETRCNLPNLIDHGRIYSERRSFFVVV